jgi:hypothetical protein
METEFERHSEAALPLQFDLPDRAAWVQIMALPVVMLVLAVLVAVIE